MPVIHENFGSLSVSARELALAVRNDEQLNNLWSFHRRKKIEVDPATTKMELYVAKLVDLLLKKNKRIQQTHLSFKKIKRDPVPRSKLIVQKHCRNGEYCFFFPITLH